MNQNTYRPTSRIRRIKQKQIKTIWKWVSILCIIVGLIVFLKELSILIKTSPSFFINPLGRRQNEAENFSTRLQTNSIGLQTAVETALSDAQGTYGIVIRNLKSNETYVLNPNTSFESGSLYKLWVMGATYQEIKDKHLMETDTITQEIPVLNDEFGLNPDTAEKTDGTVTYSVQDALYQMITISDNYAALLLTEKITETKINTFIQKNSFYSSELGDNNTPTTTASDIAFFFEKLYHNQLINKTYSQKMLSLLKQQKLNEKIPKYLPDGTIIAHKTGELDNVTHDAGIIYTNSGDYIFVILTKSSDTTQAQETIAQISKTVFNYFGNEK